MNDQQSRRAFLSRTARLAGLGAAAPWALNLAAMADAAAQTADSDYKAMVCIFLYGGNDQHNTIVPADPDSHAAYLKIRGDIALPLSGLNATALRPVNPWPSGREMAFNSQLAPLLPLFNAGHLALMMNVGTLVGQLTPAEAKKGLGLPPKLYSHNDQSLTWHRGTLDSTTGYGGRLGELMANGTPENLALSAINLSSSSFLSGSRGRAYRISGGGAVQLATPFRNATVLEATRQLLTQASDHPMQQTLATIASNSLNLGQRVNTAYNANPGFAMPRSALGDQLGAIARMIASRSLLGVKRQVFFAAIGGYDTHAGMPGSHDALLKDLAACMSAFHAATVAMGVADKVTTFTGSDFGRTLSSNGDGTDHGWGGYQFVLGGAVQGGRWYGQVPTIAVNGPEDMGSGRLIPALGVDQYMATLATWFGVPRGSLPDLIPRIGRYDKADLGFMRVG